MQSASQSAIFANWRTRQLQCVSQSANLVRNFCQLANSSIAVRQSSPHFLPIGGLVNFSPQFLPIGELSSIAVRQSVRNFCLFVHFGDQADKGINFSPHFLPFGPPSSASQCLVRQSSPLFLPIAKRALPCLVGICSNVHFLGPLYLYKP